MDIDLSDGAFVVDGCIHLGLREARLIALVVAVFAVAIQVDDHVLVKPLAVFDGEVHDLHDGLGVFAVDVKHRATKHARDVGAI